MYTYMYICVYIYISDRIKLYHVDLTCFKRKQYRTNTWYIGKNRLSYFMSFVSEEGGKVMVVGRSGRKDDAPEGHIFQFMHLEICISYLCSAYQLSFSTPIFTSMAFLHGARFLPEITFTLVGVIVLEKWKLSTRSRGRCRRDSRVKNSLEIRLIDLSFLWLRAFKRLCAPRSSS